MRIMIPPASNGASAAADSSSSLANQPWDLSVRVPAELRAATERLERRNDDEAPPSMPPRHLRVCFANDDAATFDENLWERFCRVTVTPVLQRLAVTAELQQPQQQQPLPFHHQHRILPRVAIVTSSSSRPAIGALLQRAVRLRRLEWSLLEPTPDVGHALAQLVLQGSSSSLEELSWGPCRLTPGLVEPLEAALRTVGTQTSLRRLEFWHTFDARAMCRLLEAGRSVQSFVWRLDYGLIAEELLGQLPLVISRHPTLCQVEICSYFPQNRRPAALAAVLHNPRLRAFRGCEQQQGRPVPYSSSWSTTTTPGNDSAEQQDYRVWKVHTDGNRVDSSSRVLEENAGGDEDHLDQLADSSTTETTSTTTTSWVDSLPLLHNLETLEIQVEGDWDRFHRALFHNFSIQRGLSFSSSTLTSNTLNNDEQEEVLSTPTQQQREQRQRQRQRHWIVQHLLGRNRRIAQVRSLPITTSSSSPNRTVPEALAPVILHVIQDCGRRRRVASGGADNDSLSGDEELLAAVTDVTPLYLCLRVHLVSWLLARPPQHGQRH